MIYHMHTEVATKCFYERLSLIQIDIDPEVSVLTGSPQEDFITAQPTTKVTSFSPEWFDDSNHDIGFDVDFNE